VSNTPGGQLPPEYEPVHHEPRRPGHRRPGPWRHAARQYQDPQQQYQDPRYQDPQYQGGYDQSGYAGDRFVPGFGEEQAGYAGQEPGYAEEDPRYADEEAGQGEWFDPAAQDRSGDPQQWQRDEYEDRPKRKRGKVRRLAPWVALLVILVAIAIPGLYAYHLYQNKYHPADYAGAGTGSITVDVQSGDTPTSLASELVSKGVVASTRAFILAAEHSSDPNGLEPGSFRLHEHMQASLAYAALLNTANLVYYKVTIPEGLRLSQIIPALVKADPHLATAQLQLAVKSPDLGLPSYADGKAEGYLYPDTYQIPLSATALSALKMMTTAFNQEAASINLTQAAHLTPGHLTPAEVITVASLVQAEGGRLQDYPKIARVIYNRLAQGMKLELDSTVLYGLNKYGIIASDKQLQSTSLYNTYKRSGLTPGPIDSPGNAAIEAALKPASGDWVYFVTVNPKTGETLFTDSQTQFEQYEQELRDNLGQGG
jgi:UPF0755 protein